MKRNEKSNAPPPSNVWNIISSPPLFRRDFPLLGPLSGFPTPLPNNYSTVPFATRVRKYTRTPVKRAAKGKGKAAAWLLNREITVMHFTKSCVIWMQNDVKSNQIMWKGIMASRAITNLCFEWFFSRHFLFLSVIFQRLVEYKGELRTLHSCWPLNRGEHNRRLKPLYFIKCKNLIQWPFKPSSKWLIIIIFNSYELGYECFLSVRKTYWKGGRSIEEGKAIMILEK